MKAFFIFWGIVLIAGCDSGELWRDENYIVLWIDDGKPFLACEVSKDGTYIGIIDKTVVSVSNGNTHIGVKHRAAGNSSFDYFVIEKKDNCEDYNGFVIGPINEKDYLDIKRKYELPDFGKVL